MPRAAPPCETRTIEKLPENGLVVVGVDGSERSLDALALADVLGPALGRPVAVTYVHPRGRRSLLTEDEYEQYVREVAEASFEQVREQLPPVAEREMQLVSAESAAAGLHSLAERAAAALIVIGPSRRSAIGRILVGGTGERLLSGAPVPVAVAPAGYATAEARLQTVGCGYDGSPESHAALEWAAALAHRASARLRVIGVHEPTLPARVAPSGGLATASVNDVLRRQRGDELARAISALAPEPPVEPELLDGDAADLLTRASQELDLLVLGSRGYGPIRAVLLGSVSTALARSAESPLVIVPRA